MPVTAAYARDIVNPVYFGDCNRWWPETWMQISKRDGWAEEWVGKLLAGSSVEETGTTMPTGPLLTP